MQAAGPVSDILPLEPLRDKWKAFGFNVFEIDGHNVDQIYQCLSMCRDYNNKPNLVIANTIKGKGINFAENNPDMTHKPFIDDKLIAKLFKALEK